VTTLMTKDDVVPGSCNSNFEGQWLVLDPSKYMKAEYRNAKNQLYFATGGFGCDPRKMGRKIFGTFAADFDSDYIAIREEVIGIATPEAIEKWKETYPECAANVEKVEKEAVLI